MLHVKKKLYICSIKLKIKAMETQIELQIGEKWYKVAKVEHLTDGILQAIIEAYACVDAYRVTYKDKTTKTEKVEL